MADRIVLHIDMDAFFAAVEERDKPRLRGLPIVVGADPKGGKGRGVVSTANYLARAYGIRSALPISTAWRLSEEAVKKGKPRAVFLDVNMRRYAEVSRAIMDYLRGVIANNARPTERFQSFGRANGRQNNANRPMGGMLEQASVDEAYLQLGELEIRNPNSEIRNKSKIQNSKYDAWGIAEQKAIVIKEHIKKEFGLTCSIGVGPNKLIAKIAAGVRKPDGLTVVKPEAAQAFLDLMPAGAIPGIGPKSAEALARLGARTIRELRGLSREKLQTLFGKWGLGMYERARGIDESPVVAEYEAKSIGEQETFEEDTLNPTILVAKLKELAHGVHRRLLADGKRFKTVSIVVRFADFETKTRARSLGGSHGGEEALGVIEREALQLFLPFLDRRENPHRRRIRLLGVRVEGFDGEEKLKEREKPQQRKML